MGTSGAMHEIGKETEGKIHADMLIGARAGKDGFAGAMSLGGGCKSKANVSASKTRTVKLRD